MKYIYFKYILVYLYFPRENKTQRNLGYYFLLRITQFLYL